MAHGRTQDALPPTAARQRARVVSGVLCLIALTIGLSALLDRGTALTPITAAAIVSVALGVGAGLGTIGFRRGGRVLLAGVWLLSFAGALLEGADPAPGVDSGRLGVFDAFVLLLVVSGSLLGGMRTAWCAFVGQVSSVVALLLCVHVLLGHSFGLETFYAPLGEAPTAIGTALALGLLAFSSLYVNFNGKIAGVLTDEGPSARLLRRRLYALLVASILLGGAVAAVLQTGALDSGFTLALLSAGCGALLVGFVAWLGLDLRASDRKLIEATEDLAASERMFRASFENAFVGMAHLDGSRRWERVNPRLCDLLGHESPALLRRSLQDLIDPADLQSLEDGLRDVEAGRSEAFTGEHRWIARDGGTKWFALHATARRSAAGGFRHFILVLLDVTEAKRTAEWLRLQARSLEAAASGIVITENRRPDHPIVYVNPAFERLTGYRREEVLGKNCRFLNRLAREQPELEPLRRALRDGSPCTVVLRNHAKDGTPFWNELSLSPVVDDHGVVTHTIGIQNDITKHLELAAEAEQSLREALDERGRALAAARARDVLLATVSHELRSPLNSIRLWASLLTPDARADAAMVAKSVHHIESSVETQNRLIDDLLDVSRIASGHLELDLEPVDLGALSAEVVAELRPAAEEKGLHIEDRFAERGTVVHGDRTRLMQVLRNLIENAIKFTPRGGAVVVEGGSRGAEAEIRVKDDGVGMEPEAIPRVFDQFWKANGRNGGRQGGLGLGLSIVKLVVERHGGSVSAVSEGAGCGATLTVRLPLPAAQRLPAGSDAKVPHEEPARGGYVLVVDDEVGTAEALALALGVRGLEVRTAYDADSAMARILERRPQVLLSDLVLPGPSGFDLVRRVRAQEEEGLVSRVHAIAISGRGNPSDRSNVRRAGFDDFLSKPLSVQTVFRKIEEALARPVG